MRAHNSKNTFSAWKVIELRRQIKLLTCNVSSHKTDWIFSVLFSLLPFILQVKQIDVCSWRRMSLSFACSIVDACLLVWSAFYTVVVAILLLIRWSYKQAHYFCFLNFSLKFLYFFILFLFFRDIQTAYRATVLHLISKHTIHWTTAILW